MCEISPEQVIPETIEVPEPTISGVNYEYTSPLQVYRVGIDPVDSNKQWVADATGCLGFVEDDTNEFTPVAAFFDSIIGILKISDLVVTNSYVYVAVVPTIYSESVVYKIPRTQTDYEAHDENSPAAIFTGDVIRMCRTSDGLYWIRMQILSGTRQDAKDNGAFEFELCHFNTSSETETVLLEAIIEPDGDGRYAPFSLTEGPDGLIWVLKTLNKYYIMDYTDEGSLPTASGGPPVFKVITRYTTSGVVVDSYTMEEQDAYFGVEITTCGSTVQIGYTSFEGGT